MDIFAVKRNVASDISKVLLNDIFAELDGSSEIKNIITDRLVKSSKSWWIASSLDDISTKIMAESTKKLYQWGKNQALSRYLLVFSMRILGGEYQLFFDYWSCME